MDDLNFNNENKNIDNNSNNDSSNENTNINGDNPNFIMIPREENSSDNNKSFGGDKTMDFSNNSFKYGSNENMPKKPKKKRSGNFIGYLAVALVCSMLGGLLGAGGVLYVAPQSDAFKNTELYKRVVRDKAINYGPTTLAAEKDALTVTQIVNKIGPAVVGVSTKSVQNYGLFGSKVAEGIGSGFIINEEGYILTNYHVINGAQEVKVILSDGKEVAAKVVNYDQQADMAVVKITDNIKVPGVAELGDSESVQVGESVVAIGNPLGKEFLGSVTSGIVSAVNREVNIQGKNLTLIQTDAAINPGNSGGPLVNARGQVIGINTAKINTEAVAGGVEGIGFSIPINQAKEKLGTLSKPLLKIGIAGRDVDDKTAAENKVPTGVYIAQVQEFSPAEKAGIKPGDIITSFDGQKVSTIDEVNKLKSKHNSGDVVKVEVYRDGKNKMLDLKLEE